jgi:tRNA (guanine-N7-)-methyltransferase
VSELDLNAVAVPLQMDEVFGRSAPVDVEIGVGKGRFLLELAERAPERCFLGIERAGKYHRLVVSRAARRGLTNVRLIHTSAEDLLFRLLPGRAVSSLYVLFPDPWPKKRHHKRRLIAPDVVARMAEVLVPDGRLLIKTDHPDYAEVIDEVLSAAPFTRLDPQEAFATLPRTGFEIKYERDARPIRAFALRPRL